MSKRGWIGFDLDGTLAHYNGWKGIDHIGEPVMLMVRRVQRYLRQGYTCKIFTARAHDPAAVPFIEEWSEAVIGTRLEVTNIKDFGMIRLYDDRAVRIVENTGRACCDQHRS